MSYFPFIQFTIHQERCSHRVGTDAMLLGSWTRPVEGRILDIGTGTGVLALMLAQRSPEAIVDAIEIDSESVSQAHENIAASPWPERIQVYHSSLQHWLPEAVYDLIVCNPPFFDETTRSERPARHNARHTDSLSRAELLEHSLRMLAPTGRLALVLPLKQGQELIDQASGWGLHLHRHCLVRHSSEHSPRRRLLELGRQSATTVYQELSIRNPAGEFSAPYRLLTEEYHTLHPPKPVVFSN